MIKEQQANPTIRVILERSLTLLAADAAADVFTVYIMWKYCYMDIMLYGYCYAGENHFHDGLKDTYHDTGNGSFRNKVELPDLF